MLHTQFKRSSLPVSFHHLSPSLVQTTDIKLKMWLKLIYDEKHSSVSVCGGFLSHLIFLGMKGSQGDDLCLLLLFCRTSAI